ncbi:MAG: DinB family protein [Syntrophorhabdales bacterium]
MNYDSIVREELLALLAGGNAHMGFDDAVPGFPMEDINRKVPQGTYTVWHLLEHMRIVQWDILEFVRNPGHVSPEFPKGYWPERDKSATRTEWEQSVEGFRRDLKALEEIVEDPRTSFFTPLPHARDYTVFREILLAADHNAYHVGEFVSLRRVLDMKPVKEY